MLAVVHIRAACKSNPATSITVNNPITVDDIYYSEYAAAPALRGCPILLAALVLTAPLAPRPAPTPDIDTGNSPPQPRHVTALPALTTAHNSQQAATDSQVPCGLPSILQAPIPLHASEPSLLRLLFLLLAAAIPCCCCLLTAALLGLLAACLGQRLRLWREERCCVARCLPAAARCSACLC